jgi:hypothetical protein
MSQGTSHEKVRHKIAKAKPYNTNCFDRKRGYTPRIPDRVRASLAVHSQD